MLHTKFENPSRYIERHFQLSNSTSNSIKVYHVDSLSQNFPSHSRVMVQKWPSYGLTNWFFLGLNQYPQG